MYRIICLSLAVPVIALTMYFSCKLNSEPNSVKWFIIAWLFSCCTPIWTFIAKYSTDIVFDAALFDITIFIVSMIFGIIFSRNIKDLSIMEIFGLTIMILGLIVFKYKDIVSRL